MDAVRRGNGQLATNSEAPQSFGALRDVIIERRERLPKRLMQIADFALAQPQEIAFRTVADIAGLAGVQPSALVRFAQTLGYQGFSDFQGVFRAHARNQWPDYGTRLEALRALSADGSISGDLFGGFVEASILSLRRGHQSVDGASLARAIDVLAGADIIFLLAARRSFPVAAYLAYALRRLGIRCELAEQAVGLAPEQVELLRPTDAVLVVSFTPYAQSSVDITAAAFRRGVPVVAITDSPFSPLVQSASVWLEIAEADHLGFRSLSATFALAATLAVATARQRETSMGEIETEIPS
jgi:DNA-binding MurR/RpiR family transcriptional regulator